MFRDQRNPSIDEIMRRVIAEETPPFLMRRGINMRESGHESRETVGEVWLEQSGPDGILWVIQRLNGILYYPQDILAFVFDKGRKRLKL